MDANSLSKSTTRTIHPRALKELGEEACIVALGVARDLRSRVIPPENFHMRYLRKGYSACGSACCIAGWMLIRGVDYDYLQAAEVGDLFNFNKPSDPLLAADAIERFVYDGSETPWQA